MHESMVPVYTWKPVSFRGRPLGHHHTATSQLSSAPFTLALQHLQVSSPVQVI